MPTPGAEDVRQQLLQQFTSTIEVQRPDVSHALATPLSELMAARDQSTDLLSDVVRPNAEELDPTGAGRQRFPALQGTALLFAQGLAGNDDLIREVLATPADLEAGVALDQAVGRFVYAGELLAHNGETGEVLCAAAAQRLCTSTLTEAKARLEDLSLPAGARSDIAVAFAEPFRLLDDERERADKARKAVAGAEAPYLSAIDQAQAEAALADAVDAFLTSLQKTGERTP